MPSLFNLAMPDKKDRRRRSRPAHLKTLHSPLSTPSAQMTTPSFSSSSTSRLSQRFRSLHELLPRVATACHHHHEPDLFTHDSILDPHPRRSSDSMFVLTGRRHHHCRIKPREKPHRLRFSQPKSSDKSAWCSKAKPPQADGSPEPAPSSSSSSSSRPWRKRKYRKLHTSRGERIGRRLHDHDAFLHKVLVTPVLVLLAVPVAVLTCPLCVFVVVRNSIVAG